MDFLDALRVLRRQWLVLFLGMLLTGVGAYFALGTKTQYQASAEYLVLLPPAATGLRNPTNPYVNLPPGLDFAASLIASEINTHEVAESLEDRGFTSEYTLALGPSEGPALHLNVTGTDPDNVVETRDEIIGLLDARLDVLQDIRGIPDSQMMYSQTKAADSEAVAVPGAKLKALILVTAVGVVVTLLAVFVMDGFRRARRRRKDLSPTVLDTEQAKATPAEPEAQPTPKQLHHGNSNQRVRRRQTSKAAASGEKAR